MLLPAMRRGLLGGASGGSPLSNQTNLFVAFSMRQLTPQYTGPLVRIQRSSDNTQQDFAAVNGWVSVAGVASFIGAGSGTVAKWYDQSGNGHDVAQGTLANQPSWAPNQYAGRSAAVFNGGAKALTNASVAWAVNDLQLYAVTNYFPDPNGQAFRGLFTIGAAIGTYFNSSAASDWAVGDAYTFGNQSTAGAAPRAIPMVPGFGTGITAQEDLTLSAASVDWVTNGAANPLRVAVAGQVPAVTAAMNISGLTFGFFGAVYELIVFKAVYANRLSLRANQKANYISAGAGAIDGWGDSLTAGNQDGSGTTYLKVLASLFLPTVKEVSNDGVGGQTSSQIIVRFQAKPSAVNYGNIFWTGTNGGDGPTAILSNVASMTAAVTSGKYLVLSAMNSVLTPSGNSSYNDVITVNTGYASAYGSKYLDIRSMLVAAYNPGNPVDVIDHANDVQPFTLRAKYAGLLTQSIISTDTTFTTSFTGVLPGMILQINSEYIYVLTNSGSTVTSCTRGYAGSTATNYASSQAVTMTDWIHLGANGYTFVANAIYAKMQALGGW